MLSVFWRPSFPFLILSPPVVTATLTFVFIIFLFFFVYLLHKYVNLNTMAFSFACFWVYRKVFLIHINLYNFPFQSVLYEIYPLSIWTIRYFNFISQKWKNISKFIWFSLYIEREHFLLLYCPTVYATLYPLSCWWTFSFFSILLLETM